MKTLLGKIRTSLLVVSLLVPVWPGNAPAPAYALDPPPSPTSNTRTVDQFKPYTVIDDFETVQSADNWEAGENTQSVTRTTTQTNVYSAAEGKYFLDAVSALNLQNNVWRTIYREFDTPLDLSDSRYLMTAFAHYGYYPTDRPYLVRFRVYSGLDMEEGIVRTYENKWNRIGLLIGDWAGRSAIDKIEISWQHAYDRTTDTVNLPGGDPLPYWPDPKFQIDFVHASNDLDWQFSFEDDAEGWSGNLSAGDVGVADGELSFEAAGSEPTLTSGFFRLDAETSNVVLLHVRNATANTQGVLSWTTDLDPVFDTAKSANFTLVPMDGDFTEYELRLVAHPEWKDEITRLRVTLVDNPVNAGSVYIDEIAFDKNDRAPIEYVGEIGAVEVDEDEITVTGTTGAGGGAPGSMLLLYELAPYEYEQDIGALIPVASQSAPAGGSPFSFVIDRYDSASDRYYSKFLVVEDVGGSPLARQFIASPKYATDIVFDAAYTYAYPEAQSKKGLQVEMSDDAEELGVSHAGVNVNMSYLMYKENLDPSDVIEHVTDGVVYYFQKTYVESLDRQVKPLSDNGIIVNLILTLFPIFDENLMTGTLMHPDARGGPGAGNVLAFNLADAEGVRAFKAVMEFLTERYTREDERYGRAVGYIVGNEVDAQWDWQNMGEKTVGQFMEQYEPAVRITYLAARKYYENAKIYISLTNYWAKPANTNELRFYKGRRVLELMNRLSKANGDFPWHLAHHPYPEDFFNADTWNDERVTFRYDTPQISFKNLEVLDEYMGQDRLLFNNERRRIILSEQGIQAANTSLAAEQEQAAAYAYAYYKTQFLDGIDAFILFSHIDVPVYGLYMGLWTQDPDRYAPVLPKRKKYIYDVFKWIDTDSSLAVTEFAKDIIGIEDWSEIAPDFDEEELELRDTPDLVPLRLENATPAATSGDDFESTEDGWHYADNVLSALQKTGDSYMGSGALQVGFSAFGKKWRGASKRPSAPIDATSTPYLHLAIKLTGTEAGEPYYVKIKAYSGTKTAEGIARVNPALGWTSVALDLSGWSPRNAIDKLKVWTAGTHNRNWTGNLLIDEVSFTASASSDEVNFDAVAELAGEYPTVNGTVEIAVVNYDTAALQGDVLVEGINGVEIDLAELDVQGMAFGDQKTFTAIITSYAPTGEGKPGIRFSHAGRVLEQPLGKRKQNGENQLPSYEQLLYNFEGTPLGWEAEDNVDEVSSVESFSNSPYGPVLGSYVLEAKFPTMAADVWRTVAVEPATALDMSAADKFFYYINSYGGSGGTGYETRLRLYSGTEVLERSFSMNADSWNRIETDITGWPFSDEVTKIEISFRSVGTSNTWYGSRFQLDYMGLILRDEIDNPVDLEQRSLVPIWEGDTAYNESVLMISRDEELPVAKLLYPPTEILAVRSARLDREYEENVDWVLQDGKLKLTPQSRIPYMKDREMYLPDYIPNVSMPKRGGGNVIYREGSFFHDRQIVVTYKHQEDLWNGPVPELSEAELPATLAKLREGEPLRIVLFGDSISVGANASGFSEAQPHLPIWGQLIANELERYYGSHITFINPSVGGMTSDWGVAQAEPLVADESPDLVIVAFGMNDGSGTGIGDGKKPEDFRNNIQTIIDTVRLTNPAAEFILVGTTLPNSETFFLDQQRHYFEQLSELASEEEGVAAADMTGVHEELLWKKGFADMTGNNINHPNDYLSRWYAQFVLGMLKDPAGGGTLPTGERLLQGFEIGADEWHAGTNVTDVSRVQSFTNAPYVPVQGAYALEAEFPTMAADAWRTVEAEPALPLNLSQAGKFVYSINSYGGSGGTGYETRVRLYSGVEMIEETFPINADSWNRVELDVSDWAYRDEVTGIEISFRAVGTSADWYGSRFQIDYVGYVEHEQILYDFEGSTNGWTIGTNVSSARSVEHFSNWPTRPARGNYALEAMFPTQAADVWRTVEVEPSATLDLSDADELFYDINSYGGSGGTGYETRLRLYSGANMLEETKAIYADTWNRVAFDISGWAHKGSVTKIEIAFRAVGTSADWYGSRFQLDGIGYTRK